MDDANWNIGRGQNRFDHPDGVRLLYLPYVRRRERGAGMTAKRTKPPVTRNGTTHEIDIGGVRAYVTVNRQDSRENQPCEIFTVLCPKKERANIDSAHQGWCNLTMTFASLLLQYGCPLVTIANHMKGYKFEPDGGMRGAKSIPDAIGKYLESLLPGIEDAK